MGITYMEWEHGHDAPGPPAGRKRPRTRTDAVYPRKRATAACRLCRSRKVKCNNARPACSNCVGRGAVCLYEEEDDLSGYDPASLSILDRLGQVMTRLDQLPGEVKSLLKDDADGIDAHQANESQTDPGRELGIPPAQITAEAILQWPILAADDVCPHAMANAVLEGEAVDDEEVRAPGQGFDESEVLHLIRRFLCLIHTKNPVLEPGTMWSYARQIVEDGLRWDGMSCLVLLGCALGSIAQDFAHRPSDDTSLSHAHAKANGYFDLACRRLALVHRGLLAVQCRFLAGVFLMYTLRPVRAWTHFHSASQLYYIRLQYQSRTQQQQQSSSNASAGAGSTGSPANPRIEQSLYWSCYKSECELRAELDLPDSPLASLRYPHMHPSPPEVDGSAGQDHEESWFYYLTEITLRRIANRLQQTLYARGPAGWTAQTMPGMVKAASEFELQLDEWYQGLPPPIQFSDTALPTRELPFVVQGRALEIRCSLYRPFLYFAIHHDSARSDPLHDLLRPLVDKALTWHLRYIDLHPTTHRHHGTWYELRSCIANCLCVMAAARSDAVVMPRPPQAWRAAVARCMDRMAYWEDEAPGIRRGVEIVNKVLSECP